MRNDSQNASDAMQSPLSIMGLDKLPKQKLPKNKPLSAISTLVSIIPTRSAVRALFQKNFVSIERAHSWHRARREGKCLFTRLRRQAIVTRGREREGEGKSENNLSRERDRWTRVRVHRRHSGDEINSVTLENSRFSASFLPPSRSPFLPFPLFAVVFCTLWVHLRL